MHLIAPAPARRAPRCRPASRQAGFTLIEILVTVTIVAIGLLGLAKLQAAAISETQTSRVRAVITMQAEGLANAMRAGRTFWAAGTGTLPGFTFAAGNATPTFNGAFPAAHSGGCGTLSSPCTSGELARDDVSTWVASFTSQFPTASGGLTCATTTGPVTCDLSLQWTEAIVAINRTTAAASAATSNTNYLVIHMQP